MMLKSLGLYLTQKRFHAAWVVLLCAFLPFVKIPTFSVAVVIVGLITLHRGAKEGFFLLCWLVLPGIAAGFYYGDFGALLLEGIGKGAVIWVLACVLGSTASWSLTAQVAAVCGMVFVAAFHMLLPDVSAWWLQQLSPYASQIQTTWNLDLPPDQIKLLLERVSYFATGAVVAGVLALDITLLLLARAWQAMLFNPGGLNSEWRQLRLNYLYSAALLVILAFIWLGASWLTDMLPVVLVPFLFAGLSLVHAKLPEQKHIRVPVLLALYISLLFFSPYVCLVLVFLAFLDSWYDFRAVRK